MKIRANSDCDSGEIAFWFLPAIFLFVSKTTEIVFREGEDE